METVAYGPSIGIGVARGCTGCTCTPRAEKNWGPNLQKEVVSAPQAEEELGDQEGESG